jgi:hypothetical protein
MKPPSGERGLGSPKPRRGEGGFTLTEMLIAVTIMMVVTGAVFQLLNPTQGVFQAQPEVADMQQRMRVAVDSIGKDLVMAGAGAHMGASNGGALSNFFAPIMPYKHGDNYLTVTNYFDPSAITLLYVPTTTAQTRVIEALGNNSQEMDVEAQMNCGTDKQDRLCGFKEGMRVLIFDVDGSWDIVTITNVQDAALHLQHSGKLSGKYDSGNATLTQVAAHTYYLKEDAVKKTYELRHYDGYKSDLPLVDDVVSLEFEYFGEPLPPQKLLSKPLTDAIGPWTTYGPKPLSLLVTHPSNAWPMGESCVFRVEDGQHVSRLATLDTGLGPIKLDPTILDGSDGGPWCPHAEADSKFDADLLRIRRVRVKLRVQAAADQLRGPAGLLFKKGGTSTSSSRFVPDHEIRFDVTPRNMNLGR